MTGGVRRRASFALRSLVGPWLVGPAVVLEALNFFQRGMPWRGEGMWTVEWFAIALFVIGPLATGAAAVDAARLSRPGAVHLVVGAPRPALAYVRAAAWCAGPLMAVHLLAIGAGVLAGPVTAPSVGWPAMAAAAAVQCLAIAWYVALGSAIGRFASPLVAGIAGGVAGFVAHYLLSNARGDDRFALLDLGAATVSRLGLEYRTDYLLAQAVVLAATAAALLWAPLRVRSGHRVPGVAGAGALVAAVAVLGAGPLVLPDTRVTTAPQPPRHCVAGADVEVCLYHEHRRFEELVVPPLQRLATAARQEGYDALVPARFVESSRSYEADAPDAPDAVAFSLPTEAYAQDRLPVARLVRRLVAPSHCDALRAETPPPEEYWQRVASLEMTWLEIADVGYDPARYEMGPDRAAEVLSPEEVRAILADFDRCALAGAA